eukprot:ANDGO_08410.mRNA.1 WAT1-related protein At3g18200
MKLRCSGPLSTSASYKIAALIFISVQILFAVYTLLSARALSGSSSFHPLFFIVLRGLFATPPMMLLAYLADRHVPRSWSSLKGPSMLGILGFGFSQTTYVYAIMWSSALTASLFQQLIPIVTTITSVIRKQETMSLRKGLGVATSFIGCSIIILNPFDGTFKADIEPWGIVAMVVNITSNSVYLFKLKKVLATSGIPTLTVTAISFLSGLLFLTLIALPVFLFIETDVDVWRPLREPTALGIFTVVYAGLVSSCLSFSISNIGVKMSDPMFSALFNPLQPVFVAIFGLLVFGGTPSIGQLVGGPLVLGGLSLVLYEKRREARARDTVLKLKEAGSMPDTDEQEMNETRIADRSLLNDQDVPDYDEHEHQHEHEGQGECEY